MLPLVNWTQQTYLYFRGKHYLCLPRLLDIQATLKKNSEKKTDSISSCKMDRNLIERHSVFPRTPFPRTPSPVSHKQANKNLLELKQTTTTTKPHKICDVSVPVCVLSHFSLIQLFCYPMDCSSPGSSVHRILQTRRVEQVAVSSPRGSSPKYKYSLSFSIQNSFRG